MNCTQREGKRNFKKSCQIQEAHWSLPGFLYPTSRPNGSDGSFLTPVISYRKKLNWTVYCVPSSIWPLLYPWVDRSRWDYHRRRRQWPFLSHSSFSKLVSIWLVYFLFAFLHCRLQSIPTINQSIFKSHSRNGYSRQLSCFGYLVTVVSWSRLFQRYSTPSAQTDSHTSQTDETNKKKRRNNHITKK